MALLYKELRLAAHPSSIVFAFLGCLVLVPAYPYSVVFMFGCLAPYVTFVNSREANDIWYTAVLPVTKRESVFGKCLLVVFFQLFQLLFSVPFALLRHALDFPNNPVGLDATAAWYGFGLMIYAAFDFVFLTAFSAHGRGGSGRPHPGARLDGQLPGGASAHAAAGFSGRAGLLRRASPPGVPDFRKTL